MALTAAERATLTTRLEEARAALHQLEIGQSPRVVVDQNGERVEYTMATSSRLNAYISKLERQLSDNPLGTSFRIFF